MFILATILLLLVIPLILIGVRLYRPEFSYFWLVAAFSTLAAWILVLLARLHLPQTIAVVDWQPKGLFPVSPELTLDSLSWSFALALVTVGLAVILTDVVRVFDTPGWTNEWFTWVSALLLIALGLLAIVAANPLTLLLAWAALDLLELVILLFQEAWATFSEGVVIAFSARVAGIVLLIWVALNMRAAGGPVLLTHLPSEASIPLLLAAGLRLGVIPQHLPLLREVPSRRSLGTLVRLAPVATSLVVLVRSAANGEPTWAQPYLLGLAGLAALYGSLSWLQAKDELEGRPYWILAMAGFALASALRGQVTASLAWGIALLLPGALIFLASTRQRQLFLILALGLFGFTTLPFSPAWEGVRLYSAPFQPVLVLFLLSHAFLMLGYVRLAILPGQPLQGAERWVWLIYPWGLALIPITHIAIAIWGRMSMPGENFYLGPPLLAAWPVVVTFGFMVLIGAFRNRIPPIPGQVITTFRAILSLEWLYHTTWNLYRGLARLASFINLILEGEGGILWTLLLLVLLFSLLVQQGLGG